MSEISGSPVGVMQRVIIEELKSIPPELTAPELRVDHLFDAINARKADLTTHGRSMLGLTVNALDDMQFIGAGAIEFINLKCPEDSLEDRIAVVKKSVPNLVFPAHLSDGEWQKVRLNFSERGSKSYSRSHLSPDLLFLMSADDIQERVISYTGAALIDMDSRISVLGDRGCPARGVAIHSSLGLFVDAVFSPTHTPILPRGESNDFTNHLQVVQ